MSDEQVNEQIQEEMLPAETVRQHMRNTQVVMATMIGRDMVIHAETISSCFTSARAVDPAFIQVMLATAIHDFCAKMYGRDLARIAEWFDTVKDMTLTQLQSEIDVANAEAEQGGAGMVQ